MKRESNRQCDPEILARYYDGELSEDEGRSVTAHLDHCPECRQQINDYRNLSDMVQDEIHTVLSRTDFHSMESRLLNRVPKKRLKPQTFRRWPTFPRSVFVPVSALAAALLIILYIYLPVGTEPAPSAVINSFTGSISSAMIIETPETRHTILWFTEDAPTAGEKNAAHQT